MNILTHYLLCVKLAGVVLVASALLLTGHHYGAQGVQSKWDADKLAQSQLQNKAILAAVVANEAEHIKDIQQSQKVMQNYESAIDKANVQITAARVAADTVGLRIKRAAVCTTPATGQATSPISVDAAGNGETVELPATLGRSLRDITEDADREIARKDAKIDGLQQWAIDHGFAP